MHLTEKLGKWTKNADGPRNLEDALDIAERNGAFFNDVDDIVRINDDVVQLQTLQGLKVNFVNVPDKAFDKAYGTKRHAFYDATKQVDESKFDPRTQMSWEELFGSGNTISVRVRSSVFESDRGLTAVLGHEYFELSKLHNKMTQGKIPYNEVNGVIDTLHNGAVDFGDRLVNQMIDRGF